MSPQSTQRESLWLPVDDALLRDLDALAKAAGVTRHEMARLALRLGVELTRKARKAGSR